MSRRTRIKICGISSVATATAVADAGADAIGLVFYPQSSRKVSAEQAAEIVDSLPPFISTVGLFVDPSEHFVRDVISKVRLSMLQFHGSETAEFAEQFRLPYLKAVRLGGDSAGSVQAARAEHRQAQGFLVDTYDANAAGGTGKQFDWSLFPVGLSDTVLAGGLTVNNLGAALQQTGAAAVDVSTGVEAAPGQKSPELINAFVAACREADQQVIENSET